MPIGFISSCWLLLAVLGTKVAVSAADVRMLEDVVRHPTAEGWVQAAPALGHETLRVRFALKQKNLEQLESILQKVSDPRNPAYGQYLSHENLNELVRPDDQTYSMVGTFLKGRGIQHYASLGNGDTIMVETTAATASRMLGQEFHRYTKAFEDHDEEMIYKENDHVELDANLAEVLDFVMVVKATSRVSSRPKKQTKPRTLAPSTSKIASRSLQQLFTPVPIGINPRSWRGDIVSFFTLLRCWDGNSIGIDGCADGVDVQEVTVSLTPQDPSLQHKSENFTVSANNLISYCQPCEYWQNQRPYRGLPPSNVCSALDPISSANDIPFVGCWFSFNHDLKGIVSTISVQVQYTDGTTVSGFACEEDHPSSVCSAKITPQPDVVPNFLRSWYDVPVALRGSGYRNGNRQAIAAFLNESYNLFDLTTYLNQFVDYDFDLRNYRLACYGDYTISGIDVNESIILCNNPANLGVGEATLDVQMMLGLASDVPMEFWSFTGLDDLGYMEALNGRPDSNQTGRIDAPYVHSFSYGGIERQYTEEYRRRFDIELQKLGVRGVTVLYASGDDGVISTSEDLNCTSFYSEYPTSSRYVTSVGATALSRNPNTGEAVEVVCSPDNEGLITSGGGFAESSPRPSYQDETVEAYLGSGVTLPPSSFFNQSGRGYPDISAFGTNVPIIQQGEIQITGGTSASTPIVAAMVSLLNDERIKLGMPPLGFLNPILYELAKTCSDCFLDIESGENDCDQSNNCCPAGFKAAPGWDPVTGLGSLNFRAILRELAPNSDIFTGNLEEPSPDDGDNDDDETVSSEVFAVLIAFSAFGGICLLVLIGALGYFVYRKTMGDTSFMRMEDGAVVSEAQIY
eukprot:scaffold1569_cov266-Pinguiococcus_pyrenoidosus.AAC.6